jgi:AcrR family transcriptional regulator
MPGHNPAVTQRRGPGRPREARVDAAVVEATLAEITEKGLGAATMEAIAARAGVGKATLYRRWSSKDELFYFLAAQVVDVYEPADTGDLRKDLLSVVEPHVEHLHKGRPVAVLMPTFIAEAARDDHMRQVLNRLVDDRRASMVDAFKRARKRGDLRRGVDIETLVDMISGSYSYRWLLRGEPVSVAFARKVVDLALIAALKD